MRKYNTTKEDFEIIEDSIETREEANLREIYWISYYDSYRNGYNSTPGGNAGNGLLGEASPKSKLTDEDVKSIRILRAAMSYQKMEVYEFYKDRIALSTFGKIWTYQTWVHIYPELNTEEVKTFHKHLRKNARGSNGNHSKFTEEEVFHLRELFYVEGISQKELRTLYGKGCSRSAFEQMLNGKHYPLVPMPEKSEKWRITNKVITPEEIHWLREQYSLGKSIEELKVGIFANYCNKAILNIVNRISYKDI